MAAGVVTLVSPRPGGMEETMDRARRMKRVIEAHGGRFTLLNCLSGGTMTGMMATGIWRESLTALGQTLDPLGQDPAWLKLRAEMQSSPPQATLGSRIFADVAGFDASMTEHPPGQVMSVTSYTPAPGQLAALMKYFAETAELLNKVGIPVRVRRALYSGAPVSYQFSAFYKGGIGEALAFWDSTVLTDPEWQALVQRQHAGGISQNSSALMRPVPLE
jgi:hypothetical protein